MRIFLRETSEKGRKPSRAYAKKSKYDPEVAISLPQISKPILRKPEQCFYTNQTQTLNSLGVIIECVVIQTYSKISF